MLSSGIKHLADFLGVTEKQAEEEADRNMNPMKYVDPGPPESEDENPDKT